MESGNESAEIMISERAVIRKGRRDEAPRIAELIFLAMEDILYQFIGDSNAEMALKLMTHLVTEEANQYSHENCWVIALDNHVIGVAVVYQGQDLAELRKPVEKLIHNWFGRPFNPEDETQAGEIYIDSVVVDPAFQGQGYGRHLFNCLIREYAIDGGERLGLLVEETNVKARRFYESLGFIEVGEKTLVGKKLFHLQIKK